MKVIGKVFFVLLFVAAINDAFAQGVVTFQNGVLPSPPDRLVRDVGGTPLSGTNFIAQLLYQDRTGTWVPHPIVVQFYDRSLPVFAGYWRGADRTLVNAGGMSPFDPSHGFPVNMQVRVWDGGSEISPLTFDQAVAAGMKRGTSGIFVYIEEFDLETDDKLMKNFQGFTLVPEPSTWALFALGMGWLVWRRRKC